MQTTDMSEKGLESLIEKSLLNEAHYEKGFSSAPRARNGICPCSMRIQQQHDSGQQ